MEESRTAVREAVLSMLDGFLSVNGFYLATTGTWWKLKDMLHYWEKSGLPAMSIIIFLDNEFKEDPPQIHNIAYLNQKVDKLIEHFKTQMAEEQVPKPA